MQNEASNFNSLKQKLDKTPNIVQTWKTTIENYNILIFSEFENTAEPSWKRDI